MNNFDTTTLEDAFRTILAGLSVSNHIYTDRPKASPQADDFVVAKVVGDIVDTACYANCNVYVYLFAKDVQAQKNGKKLSVMYGKLSSGMPSFYGEYLIDPHPSILGDIGDDYGFHSRIIKFKVTIKVQ